MSVSLYLALCKQSVHTFIIYRTTSLLTFLMSILFFVVELYAGVVYFDQIDQLYGWTREDYLVLISLATTVTYLYQTFFVLAHEHLTESILDAQLDMILLKPVNAYLFYALYRLDISSAISAMMGLGVTGYFLQSYTVTVVQYLYIGVCVLLAVGLLFSLNQIIVTCSFWYDNLTSLLAVPEYLTDFLSRPRDIFPSTIRGLFTWGVPLLIAFNSPVLILRGEMSVRYVLSLVLSNAIFGFIAWWLWRKGVERYRSAS